MGIRDLDFEFLGGQLFVCQMRIGRERKGTCELTASDAPHGKSVVLVIVVGPRVQIRGIQVQVIRVVTIVSRRRPIVRVVTAITRRGAIPAAGVDEIVRIHAEFVRVSRTTACRAHLICEIVEPAGSITQIRTGRAGITIR